MADVQFCIYDGQGSNREDWENKMSAGDKEFVACDHHNPTQFKKDVSELAKNNLKTMAELESLKAAKVGDGA